MKLGVYLNAQHRRDRDPGRCFAETIEQVRLIRQLGFDSIWGGEHHVIDDYHYFPLLPLLQRLSAEAEGMEIGTNIVLLPLHNPVEVAEIAAFLDVATGGKFQLGVGLGYRPEEFEMFGVPFKERVSRMVEGVEIIRRLWTESKVSHRGRHWQFDNFTIGPQPANKYPHPPILVAAQVDTAIERAARIGDGWAMVPTPRLDEIEAQITTFNEVRARAGLEPAEHFVRLFEVACADDEETALSRTAPFLLEKYASYMKWGMPGLRLDEGDAPEEQLRKLAENRFGVGAPEQIVDALMAQHRAGITHITMRASWPGMPQADILASLEMIGTKVLPEVRRRIATSAQDHINLAK